ncbi:unnamed protein product [Amoebophrya sp. A25]|nr:unnamed protein product [Amoebophrya sp. A25]|eukprot:GSA25T00026136001.1
MKSHDKFTTQWYGPVSVNGTDAPYHPRSTKVIDVSRSYIPLHSRKSLRDYLDQTLPPNASAPWLERRSQSLEVQSRRCFANTWSEGWFQRGPIIRRETPEITAAGQPSGMPVPLNSMEKFGTVIPNWPGRIEGERNMGPFTQVSGNNQSGAFMTRFRTMKYDSRYTMYDVPRRHCPSDYTGFPRRYITGEGYTKFGQDSLTL